MMLTDSFLNLLVMVEAIIVPALRSYPLSTHPEA